MESYIRFLFIDCNSAFILSISDILLSKLSKLRLTCIWIKDFLANKSQLVSPHLPWSRTLIMGSTQECELSPLLYNHIFLNVSLNFLSPFSKLTLQLNNTLMQPSQFHCSCNKARGSKIKMKASCSALFCSFICTYTKPRTSKPDILDLAGFLFFLIF